MCVCDVSWMYKHCGCWLTPRTLSWTTLLSKAPAGSDTCLWKGPSHFAWSTWATWVTDSETQLLFPPQQENSSRGFQIQLPPIYFNFVVSKETGPWVHFSAEAWCQPLYVHPIPLLCFKPTKTLLRLNFTWTSPFSPNSIIILSLSLFRGPYDM